MKNREIACVVGRVISRDFLHSYITLDGPERGELNSQSDGSKSLYQQRHSASPGFGAILSS